MKKKYREYKFELHKYPYVYMCARCKERFEGPFEMTKEYECQLKKAFEVESDLPLFFECDGCHDDELKPIGYTGKPSFILNSDSGW